MKKYIGAKIILGEPMDENTFLSEIKHEPTEEGRPTRAGYHVIYEDGYESWSPKATFENAYREITPGEIELVERASIHDN